MSEIDDLLGVEESFAQDIRDEILSAIYDHEHNRPRSKQKRVGPSEAGHPCSRKLALQITATEKPPSSGDPLPSMIGTSMHLTMESVMANANEKLGRERWLTENKVLEPIEGSCDLFDTDTGTVIDYKFPGASRFKKYTTEGPSPEYREQAHLYGLGYQNLGYEVKNVGIMFIPRAGRLKASHLWMEPFDPDQAAKTARRLADLQTLSEAMDLEHHPELIRLVPATPTESCMFCPWFDPAADGTGRSCVGQAGDPNK